MGGREMGLEAAVRAIMPNALRDLFWKYIDLDEYMAAVSFGRLTPCAVQTLGILGRRESVQVLDSLGAKEHESEAIREAVREARAVLLGEREARGTKWISPRGQPNWPR
jgi:hypothetical protein